MDLPIAQYKMNDVAASSAVVDAMGLQNGVYGIAGTPGNVNSVPGKISTALSFNGTDEFISLADNAAWDNMKSIAAWVKLAADYTDLGYISARATSAATSWRVFMETHANDRIIFMTGGDSTVSVSTTSGIPRNVWTFLVVTFDGTTGSIYIDNVEATYAAGQTIVAVSDTAIKPTFGARWDNEATPTVLFPMKGALDNVLIFDRVLTPPEISVLWNNGNGTEGFGEAGRRGRYSSNYRSRYNA